jgi:cytochrome c-type biogenesis protein CcmE
MDTRKNDGPNAEKALLIAAIVIACVTGSMALVGGSRTWTYYLTVEECRAGGRSLLGKRIRVNGTVRPDSLAISEGRTTAAFALTGAGEVLQVACSGPIPDNLAEGVQVVVEGELQRDGRLRGERVLTKCASKYQAGRTELARSPGATGRGSLR